MNDFMRKKLTQEKVIEKFKEKHGNKFVYDKFVYFDIIPGDVRRTF